MNIQVETKSLKRAVFLAGAEIKSKSTLPILGNLKLEAYDSSLTITGTNLDIFIVETIDAEVKEAGEITLPFATIGKLIDRITSQKIRIKATEKEAEIKAGEVTATFELLPADEYPPVPKLEKGQEIECLAQEFIKPLAMIAHAMSDDPSRYAMMGVNMSVEKNGIDFAATSGTRMAVFASDIRLDELDLIVPDSAVRTILRNYGETKEPLKITLSENEIRIVSERSLLVSRLVEAKFPRYRQVIPGPGKNVFSCDRKELIEAVKTVSLFAPPPTCAVKFTGKGKEIEVSADGRASSMVLGSELQGQPEFQITFNYRYLLAALGVLETDTVRIECSDGSTPALIREGAFRAVLVPVMNPAK